MSEEEIAHRLLNPEFLDGVLESLDSRKDEWATLPVSEKVELLKSVRRCLKEHAREWVEATARGKKLEMGNPLVVEEWATGPYPLAVALNALIDTLTSLTKGQTKLPGHVRTRPDGQVVAKVFPHAWSDNLLMNGVSAEVWMDPEVTPENLVDHTALLYKKQNVSGKVSLVLGAGNVASVCPLDVLYMMFAKGYVVLAKLNEVNDCMYVALEKIFKPLIDAGYLHYVCGNIEVGKYLTDHDLVEHIHMTGSAKTHDAILWGVGEEGKERKRANNPRLTKSITSELGGIGAVIVVPGPWTKADIEYQAEHIATIKLHNGGCNCIAGQILVLPRTWEKSEEVLEAVRNQFRKLPEREKFYPGAEARLQEAVSKSKNSEVIKGRALITDLDAKRVDEFAFHNEFFTTVLGQTYLEGEGAKSYLENAVNFANDTLDGTLGVSVIIHPKTMKELGGTFEDFIAKLRFGSIGINAWCGAAYFLPHTSWGAFPGHTLDDIQSGIDVVHNAYLFDKPQKSVVYAPFWETPRSFLHGSFTAFPKPPWFVTNKTSLATLEKLTDFTLEPQITRLPSILITALRG